MVLNRILMLIMMILKISQILSNDGYQIAQGTSSDVNL